MVFEHGDTLPNPRKAVNKTVRKPYVRGNQAAPKVHKNELIKKDRFRSDSTQTAVSKRVGYIRVSTKVQVADRQVLRLQEECDVLHLEEVSAVAASRPIFETVVAELKSGDTFVVVDLDRAFRSSIDAMLTADLLRQRGVNFRILSLNIDTGTPEGELFYSLVASFAQYERRIISRRTKEGLEAARNRGVRLGRPCRLSPESINEAHDWIAETGLPCRYVAALLGVSRITLQRGFRKLRLTYPLEGQ